MASFHKTPKNLQRGSQGLSAPGPKKLEKVKNDNVSSFFSGFLAHF